MPLGRARPSGMRFILAILFALVGGNVSAATTYPATQCYVWTASNGGAQTPCVTSQAEAIAAARAVPGYQTYYPPTGDSYVRACSNFGATNITSATSFSISQGTGVSDATGCVPFGNAGPINRGNITTACGANSTLGGSTCTCTGSAVVNPAGNACEAPNACTPESGKEIVSNFTVGWVQNPNAIPVDAQSNTVGDYLGPQLNTYTCVAGCRRYIDALSGGTQGFVSAEPSASGLYRLSMDFVTVGQGSTCTTPPNDPSNPNAPNPACPGTVGEVNGKPVCLPKAGPNSPPLPTPSNPASAPPSGAPVTPGNPAAGDKPATGTGAGSGGGGRTPTSGGGGTNSNPTTGGGGNSGGSSGAASGGSSTGGTTSGGSSGGTTTGTDKPVQPCGLTAATKCKIDETGTGTGAGALDGAKGQFDTEAGKQNTQIGGAGTSVTGVAWNWAFTLPAGACTPFDFSTRLGPVSINPCTNTWFALFRSAMGYFFFGLTGFYIWHKATSAPTGGK